MFVGPTGTGVTGLGGVDAYARGMYIWKLYDTGEITEYKTVYNPRYKS